MGAGAAGAGAGGGSKDGSGAILSFKLAMSRPTKSIGLSPVRRRGLGSRAGGVSDP